MSDWSGLLEGFKFPHTQRGGATLVSRADAPRCLDLIYSQGWRFLGYDSFMVTDEFIQPHFEWSPDWSRSGAPGREIILAQMAQQPNEVTHYGFVFNDAA